MGLPVHSPFEHTQDDVIVTVDKSLDLCVLLIGQVREICAPLIVGSGRDAGDNSINSRIKLRIDSENKIAEVWQTCRPRDASTNNEENLAARMRKKEALRNGGEIWT
jgi:hypothetical protein